MAHAPIFRFASSRFAWLAIAAAVVGCGDSYRTAVDDLTPGPDAGSPAEERPGPGDYRRTISVGGLERDFSVFIPPGYAPDVSLPLVVDLHALAGNEAVQASLSGLRTVAREQRFAVLWPQGIDNSWNGYNCCGNALLEGIDDVGFVVAAIDDVAATWRVDRQRVYVTGYGNGGALAHRLACERADVFAAAAPVAYASEVAAQGCSPFRPVSILQLCGSEDTASCTRGRAENSFEAWAALNFCAAPQTKEGDCSIYETCEDGVTTALCSPAATQLDIYQRVDVAGVVWHFFSGIRLPRFATAARAGE